MFENISADITQAFHRRGINELIDIMYFIILESHGLQALVIYRFGRWLKLVSRKNSSRIITTLLYPIYRLLSWFIIKAYGINIDLSADIAMGCCITHFGGIELRNCRVGSGCNIHQQVRIVGDNALNHTIVIGDKVYIGAHAKIFNNVTIGDGATIGAGAIVKMNVPEHSLILGAPARVVHYNYINSALL